MTATNLSFKRIDKGQYLIQSRDGLAPALSDFSHHVFQKEFKHPTLLLSPDEADLMIEKHDQYLVLFRDEPAGIRVSVVSLDKFDEARAKMELHKYVVAAMREDSSINIYESFEAESIAAISLKLAESGEALLTLTPWIDGTEMTLYRCFDKGCIPHYLFKPSNDENLTFIKNGQTLHSAEKADLKGSPIPELKRYTVAYMVIGATDISASYKIETGVLGLSEDHIRAGDWVPYVARSDYQVNLVVALEHPGVTYSLYLTDHEDTRKRFYILSSSSLPEFPVIGEGDPVTAKLVLAGIPVQE